MPLLSKQAFLNVKPTPLGQLPSVQLYGSGCYWERVTRLRRVLDNVIDSGIDPTNLIFLHDHKGWITISSKKELTAREKQHFRGAWAGEDEGPDEVLFVTDQITPGLPNRDDNEIGNYNDLGLTYPPTTKELTDWQEEGRSIASEEMQEDRIAGRSIAMLIAAERWRVFLTGLMNAGDLPESLAAALQSRDQPIGLAKAAEHIGDLTGIEPSVTAMERVFNLHPEAPGCYRYEADLGVIFMPAMAAAMTLHTSPGGFYVSAGTLLKYRPA